MAHAYKIVAMAALGTVGAFVGTTAASAGGGCHYGVTEGSGTVVELKGACFTPTTLVAEPGETITFVNRDDFVHNITANDWGHFDDLLTGDRYTTSFANDGIYSYACTYHPGMSGAIVVGEGATGADVVAGPVTASAAPSSGGDRVAAGAIGLLIGAAAGTGLASLRRRASGA